MNTNTTVEASFKDYFGIDLLPTLAWGIATFLLFLVILLSSYSFGSPRLHLLVEGLSFGPFLAYGGGVAYFIRRSELGRRTQEASHGAS